MDDEPAAPEPTSAEPVSEPQDVLSTMPGGRRGWTLRQRMAAPDAYGLLLFLILLSMISIAGLADSRWERTLSAALLAFTLLFALRTSRAGRMTVIAAYVITPLLLIVAAFASASSGKVAHIVSAAMVLVLLLAVLGAILARMGTHLTISWQTVLAGVCIYLLVGLVFGSLFTLLGATDNGVLFTGGEPANSLNTTYFSFTTLSTVGYGDLTMADGFTKMLAVTEAVLGQIYLVVAVGLLIGNLGRERVRRRPEN